MTNLPYVPKGYSVFSPYLTVADVPKSADFYKSAFGFEVLDLPVSDSGQVVHGELRYEGQVIMIGQQGAYGGTCKTPHASRVESPISLYLYAPDVDALFQKAKAAGATVLGEPEEQFWGDRMCRLQDLDGYLWCFASISGQP